MDELKKENLIEEDRLKLHYYYTPLLKLFIQTTSFKLDDFEKKNQLLSDKWAFYLYPEEYYKQISY